MAVNRLGTDIVIIVLHTKIFNHFFMVVLIPTGTITVGQLWSWLLRLSIRGLMSWGNCSLIFCTGSGAGWIRLYRHAGMGTNNNS